jgi:hypothetical protein
MTLDNEKPEEITIKVSSRKAHEMEEMQSTQGMLHEWVILNQYFSKDAPNIHES